MFIEEATSCRSSILMELEFGGVSFCQEGKPEKPEKKHSEQGESNPHGTASEFKSNPGYIYGRRALLPLRHPFDFLTDIFLHKNFKLSIGLCYFLWCSIKLCNSAHCAK